MASRFMEIFLLKTLLDKLCKNTGFHLPVFFRTRTELLCPYTVEYGLVKTRILAYFMYCISQIIILTHI